ncbi:hypothetical protein ABZS94_15155 [Streptomyces sp. NPDC005500]|uniref:hypothetical protein n=1 Tax=unclassified Streptomyces TaxID=2593676 RepID=UPI0033AD73AB
MLRERESLGLKPGNVLEPLPALGGQLPAWQVWVLRAQSVGGDPECVKSGGVDVGCLQPADDVQCFHAACRDDLGVSIPLPGDGEDRMGHGAEGGGNDRLVEVARHDLAGLPPLPLADHAGAFGQRLRRVGSERGNHFGL